MDHRWQGIAFALLSAILFGVSTPLAKALLGGVSPWMLAGLLYLGSGVGLAAFNAVRSVTGTRSDEAPLCRRDAPWLAAVILSGGIIGPVLLMVGLRTTSASTASLLLNLEGLFTLAIAWTVFRENADKRIALGAAAILIGAVLLSWSGGPEGIGWGALAVAGACLAWGIDNNLTRKLSSSDPLRIAMVKGLVAGTVNVSLAFSLGDALPPAQSVLGAAAVGFVGYGVSLVLFVLALRHLGSARTGAYFCLAPFVGAVVAIFVFGEPITDLFLAAAVLMGFGLYLHLVERHEHRHVHDATTHVHRHVHDEHHRHLHGDGDMSEPHTHTHTHTHEPLVHAHPHFPDTHHRHAH